MRKTLPPPVGAAEALIRLRAGNQRFVSNVRCLEALGSQTRRDALTHAQSPNAIILSCADSRVPSELVFDCGLGELFVVRVAGNVCAPSLVGSVEFAAAAFGTELVVVMGHSNCGAVTATLDALQNDNDALTENIQDIVSRIKPSLLDLVGRDLRPEELLDAAVRANVVHTANQLRHGSPLLEQRVKSGQLMVVGAEYSLETGEVDFFDMPADLKIPA